MAGGYRGTHGGSSKPHQASGSCSVAGRSALKNEWKYLCPSKLLLARPEKLHRHRCGILILRSREGIWSGLDRHSRELHVVLPSMTFPGSQEDPVPQGVEAFNTCPRLHQSGVRISADTTWAKRLPGKTANCFAAFPGWIIGLWS